MMEAPKGQIGKTQGAALWELVKPRVSPEGEKWYSQWRSPVGIGKAES